MIGNLTNGASINRAFDALIVINGRIYTANWAFVDWIAKRAIIELANYALIFVERIIYLTLIAFILHKAACTVGDIAHNTQVLFIKQLSRAQIEHIFSA